MLSIENSRHFDLLEQEVALRIEDIWNKADLKSIELSGTTSDATCKNMIKYKRKNVRKHTNIYSGDM